MPASAAQIRPRGRPMARVRQAFDMEVAPEPCCVCASANAFLCKPLARWATSCSECHPLALLCDCQGHVLVRGIAAVDASAKYLDDISARGRCDLGDSRAAGHCHGGRAENKRQHRVANQRISPPVSPKSANGKKAEGTEQSSQRSASAARMRNHGRCASTERIIGVDRQLRGLSAIRRQRHVEAGEVAGHARGR